MDKGKIAELKAANLGIDLHLLTSTQADGETIEVVVRAPSRGQYKKFLADKLDQQAKIYANDNLLKGILLHPPLPEFEALLERKPGMCEEFSEVVMELTGVTGEARAVKL